MKYKWPLLQKLLETSYFDFVDMALAEYLSKRFSLSHEETAAFLCYLSFALRQGHLCIKVNDTQILPDPFMQQKKSLETVSKQDILHLIDLIKQAAKELPKHIVNDTLQENSEDEDIPICHSGDFFYFQRYWIYEQNIQKQIHNIDNAKSSLQIDVNAVSRYLSSLIEIKLILPLQAEAILKGCQNNITIIIGGPGTGKTYTAGELLKALWLSLSEDERRNCSIVLAAPTGKAASNLERGLLRATKDLQNFPILKAKTLHSLLGLNKPALDEYCNKINAKVVIVDECSMMDANMMSKLLAAIHPGTKLILLGDKHQLPPISTGMLFADIIEILSKKAKCVELKQCLRTDLKEILDFANEIKNGNSQEATHRLVHNRSSIKLVSCDQEKNIKKQQNEILEYAFPLFLKQLIDENSTPELLVNSLQTFCILSPFRQGPSGTEQLNRLFLQKMISTQNHKANWIGIPIVISNNNQRFELSNGEMGVLIYHFDSNSKQSSSCVLEPKQGDYALFPNKSRLPALMLPKYEPAFCLSVHKSQGSEYDHVMLIMPEGSELFGREMLYTAVTRARKELELWSTPETIQNTIANYSQRLSGLKRT